jgi:hypothetical protein
MRKNPYTHVSIYQGWRDDEGTHVLANDKPLRHVSYHSPSGFEWGYGGSGPADLALSILSHYFNERYLNTAYLKKYGSRTSQAWLYHQRFKWDFVSKWEKREWMISSEEIAGWLKKQNQSLVLIPAA